jgi:polyhydroxybutyrate depolymerase
MIQFGSAILRRNLLGIFAPVVFLAACSSAPAGNSGGAGGDESWTGGAGGMGTGGTAGAGVGGMAPAAGCGMPAKDADETYVSIPVTVNGNTQTRQFFISIPVDYDSKLPNRLIVGLHGRDYSGDDMKSYLGLEKAPVIAQSNEIFVYPDALLRDFGSWGSAIGWQLGPGAADTNAAGDEDVAFIDALISYMTNHYCIDSERIFVTGQSWGGDFSSALACIRGDVFRASVPVAANGVYYLESPDVPCKGASAVWAMHGKGDPYFDITLGEEYRDFFVAQNKCSAMFKDLGITTASGSAEDCVEYSGCTEVVRYCAYDASFGHQVPDDYYATETMDFFRSF